MSEVKITDHEVGTGAEATNGVTVNVPSYQVSPSDVVSVRHKARSQARVQFSLDLAEQYGFPGWVDVDTKRLQGTFKHVPERAELPPDIQEQLVVELYSK